jgi:hypothetical protein
VTQGPREWNTAREVWWVSVVAGFRSPFGAAVFFLMVAVTVILFAAGQFDGAIFMVILTLFIYGRVPAAVGARLARPGADREPRQR